MPMRGMRGAVGGESKMTGRRRRPSDGGLLAAASASAKALRIASRMTSCVAASPMGRSSAKLRHSPLTAYWRAGDVDVPTLMVPRGLKREDDALAASGEGRMQQLERVAEVAVISGLGGLRRCRSRSVRGVVVMNENRAALGWRVRRLCRSTAVAGGSFASSTTES